MRNVLITGFEGYGGRLDNPSAMIADALGGMEVGGAKVVARTLPVSFSRVPELIRGHIDDLDPVSVIGTGLWPGEAMIRIERLGINFAEFGIPDNEGLVEAGPVAEGEPDAIAATWPARQIVARLVSQNIPARMSEHAGTFLCNATLYLMLRAVREKPNLLRAGFMHVPYLPAQVCDVIRNTEADRSIEIFQRQDIASMTIDLQIKAATIAIETTLATLQQ